MRIFTICLLLFIGFRTSAQDLTGIWRGTFQSSDGISNLLNTEDRYKFEIQLDQRNKKFEGVTYSYKTTVFYGKAIANGTVNPLTGKVMLQEMKLVEVKMQQSSFACVQTFFMQYTKNGNVETLEGKYTSFRQDDSSICDRGTVSLVRVVNSDFYKEPFLVKRETAKKNSKAPSKSAARPTTPAKPRTSGTARESVAKSTKPKLNPTPAPVKPDNTVVKPKPAPPVASQNRAGSKPKSAPAKRPANPPVARIESRPLSETKISELPRTDSSKTNLSLAKKLPALAIPRVLTTRENDLIKTVVVNSASVSVNIYDNGTIDHDTISVYLDKRIVVSRQMLTLSPINVKIDFEEDDTVHELTMVAENLGDFPPNTSLMVIRAGDQQFEVRITSNEQKNAVVKFKYERPK